MRYCVSSSRGATAPAVGGHRETSAQRGNRLAAHVPQLPRTRSGEAVKEGDAEARELGFARDDRRGQLLVVAEERDCSGAP